MAKKPQKGRKTGTGVEVFKGDDEEAVDLENLEPSDEELNALENGDTGLNDESEEVAVAAKAKTPPVEPEEDDDFEVDEPAEEGGFSPWIYHAEAEWTLKEAFNEEGGGDIVIYDLDNTRWYKLMPINVGELPSS